MFIFNIILVVLLNFLLSTEIVNAVEKCKTLENIKQCPVDDVEFYLYTRKIKDNPHRMYVNNDTSIETAEFISGKEIIVLIHGYTGHKDFSPNMEIRPAYLENGDYNIISIDYGSLVRKPCYLHSVYNIPAVAICIADILEKIIKIKEFKWTDIHIIGFSLGAHVAGMIANYVKSGKIERITGLDPAKPGFIVGKLESRLDKGDAKFVDVIHTDVMVRGMLKPMGHIDFYVNGGKLQPGCKIEKSTSSCNHNRASIYYAESINSKVGFYGFKCSKYVTWQFGFCTKKNSKSFVIMGPQTPATARGYHFLETNSKSPFAQGGKNKK